MRIPRVPPQAKNRNYQLKHLSLLRADGTVDENNSILPSLRSASAFIISVLNDMGFPMAAYEGKLREYRDDPDYWVDDMTAWIDDYSRFDDDTSLYFTSRGVFHTINSETTLEEAIAAYYAVDYVDSMYYIDSGGLMVYNGWIIMDEKYDMWIGDMDPPDGWQDYEWKNIRGTLVEVYPREEELQ